MELLTKRLTNLLSIKSIVTLTATVLFAVLAVRGDINSGEFLSIFTVIIGFYFGTQTQKERENVSQPAGGEKMQSLGDEEKNG